uniref:CAZy families GH35 protein n=1 Tax=uncultured Xylanimonas sp. TaxID=876087 RepID=A0A060BQT0_9MICO|nr:CAZy families GH35 protein [uncultured Xylanimonas sp.]
MWPSLLREELRAGEKGDQVVGIAQCREVEIKEGKLETVRFLNGDQTHQGRHVRVVNGPFTILYVKLYKY